MSDEHIQPESGGTDQPQSEPAHSPSEGQSVNPTPTTSLLTVQNVQKLQEEYPTSKSALARWSIETYMRQSSHFLNESRSGADQSKDQNLADEKEAEAGEVLPPKENTSEGYPEKSEASSKDFLTSTLPSSIPETGSTKRRDVADIETQTEWSYSGSSEEKENLKQEEMEIKKKTEEEKKEEILLPAGPIKVKEEDSFLSREEISSSDESESPPPSERRVHQHSELCQLGCCEFCSSFLKPLPSPEELEEDPEIVEDFICCGTYKDIFHCVIEELMEQDSSESEIDITPHRHLPLSILESETKRLLKREIEERGFKNYRDILKQYIKYGPCVKLTFRLKDNLHRPRKIVKKKRPSPEDLLEIDLEFKAEQLKMCDSTKAVKRYYPDGKIFYILFPDGTGQVYYPSGNIAIMITYVSDVQYSYIILSDDDGPKCSLQAFFTNQGYAAYYHQNGNLRLNLDLCFGFYFDRKKIQKKHWNWWDTSSHIHAPPIQPLSIQLNAYIQVRIEGQDKIFLTFSKLHNCIRFNVGARLKLKDEKMLRFLKEPEGEEELLSHSKKMRTRRIIASFHKLVKMLCCEPSEHTQDLYLILSALLEVSERRYKTKHPA